VNERSHGAARAALFFALATVVMTWPMALHPGGLYSSRQDQYLGLWNLEWVARWLTHPTEPFFRTETLLFPLGAGLEVQPLSPLQGVLAAPLTLTAGPLVAYNVLALFSFWFAGWMTFLWASRHTASRLGACLAGVVYTFAPHHFTYLPQLNLVQIGVVPLYLWCAERLTERPTRARALVAGLVLAAVGLCDWYYGLAAGAVGLVLAALRWRAAAEKRGALVLELCHFGACLVVLLPVVVPMARGFVGKEFVQVEEREGIGLVMEGFKSTGYTVWLTSYVGFAALGLALVGMLGGRRARAALVLTLVSLVFALGRSVSLGGVELPLPFALLERLPVLGSARYPDRFFVLTQLGIGWLAALGLERLVARFPGRARLLEGLALTLVFLEFAPFGLTPSDEFVATIVPSASAAPAGAVFHVPTRIGNRDGEQMFLQLAHGRAIGGAYLTRRDAALERELAAMPGLGSLYGARLKEELPDDLRTRLAELGFAYVCVRRKPVQRGIEMEAGALTLSFRLGGRGYLRQRLMPGYQDPREIAAHAEQWLAALTGVLGPPERVTDEEALFRVAP
jgi:hypothetical protein